jgi:hypothetical protein
MKHASTRALFEYWNQRRGRRRAPARADIDPADIRHILGDTFMLSADFAEEIRFRLAGTRICALFSREIKGEAFDSLWGANSSPNAKELLACILDENVGMVAGVVGHTDEGAQVELELLLLPLAFDRRTRVRVLGALTPLIPPYWLGEQPVIGLELRTLRHVGGKYFRLGAPDFGRPNEEPQTKHGFLVYSGGRIPSPDKQAG